MDSDVTCPLCDYNLRGLTEPRCPECGHAFDWDDVRDRAKRVRWLYEHSRGVAVGSASGTLIRSLLPERFWSAVRPTHEVSPRRLLVYLLLLLAIASIGSWLPLFAYGAIREYSRLPAARAQLRASMHDADGNLRPEIAMHLRRIGVNSVDEYIDSITPSPIISALWYAGSTWRPMQRLLVPIAAWPILTVALLVAFRLAFRQKHVGVEHFWRIAVYSIDFLLIGWAMLLPIGHWLQPLAHGLDDVTPLYDAVGRGRPASGANLLLMGLLLVVAIRFEIAYRRYLGWPHGWRAPILIQAFVLLAIVRIMIFVNSPRW
jgi:hypothetical protein